MDSSKSLSLSRPLSDTSVKGTSNTSLQGLSTYLQENHQPGHSRIKICPSIPAVPVCESILQELMKRGHLTDVQVPSARLRLREIDGFVEISMGAESSKLILSNTSLMQVQQNLVNNLIIRNKHCPLSVDTVQLILSQIMTNLKSNPDDFAQCPEFYKSVAIYIVDHPTISAELLFVAVKHIIQHAEYYTLKFASQAAQVALRHSENCSSKKSAEAAQYIIDPCEINHRHESKMGAVLYIVLQAYSFSTYTFTRAVNHLLNNIEDYPKGFVTIAAKNFIQQNSRFFNEPLKNQQEFVDFYTSRKEIAALADYSDKLTKILESDNRKIAEKTVLELWWLGDFASGLDNEAVSIFILKNTLHDAITLRKEQ